MSRKYVHGDRSSTPLIRLRLRLGIAAICLLWVLSLAPEQLRIETAASNSLAQGEATPFERDELLSEGEEPGTGAAEANSVETLLDVVEPASQRIFSREILSTTLISATSSAAPGNGASRAVAIAAGGGYVAFVSQASNLLTDVATGWEGGGYDQVFVYDRSGQTTEVVSVNADGEPGNGWSGAPAITPDGRYVAFYSWASDLVEGDTNGVQDLFVYDRQTNAMERVSVDGDGRQANGRSGDNSPDARPALSADGRYVAFHAAADNLVAGDTNQTVDVFVHDRRTHTTTRVSVTSDGFEADAGADSPVLSVDGRYVAFQSRATNLDRARLNVTGASQIYVHDRATGITELVSRSGAGVLADRDAEHAALSGDGQLVFFQSAASNLVAQDSNRAMDIFMHDRTTGATSVVSVASSGIQGNRDSSLPAVSLDGRYVAYLSAASNLIGHDSNGVADVFVYDRLLRHTMRASVAVTGQWTGEEADGDAMSTPSIALGGQAVAFVSVAANLAPGDDNRQPDVFLHMRQDPQTYTVIGTVVDTRNRGIDGALVVSGPHQVLTNHDGRYVIPNLVGGTYTVRVAAPGYEFIPGRQTISVLSDLTLEPFLGLATRDASVAFLDLPIAYDGTIAGFLAALRDTDDGGRVAAWFDHDTPDYNKNGAILLWDGHERVQGAYNPALGCYLRRCYDGHDGIDFPYEDPVPETAAVLEPATVRAAGAGRVVDIHVDCTMPSTQEDPVPGPGCNGGYGNEVIVAHENGYFTRYSHLDEVLARVGGMVSSGDAVGVMGSTGNSNGVHLHFAVHWDNGNGRWDGEDVDGPIDPFGWSGSGLDPWSPNQLPMVSHRLWRVDTAREANLLGGVGATLQDATGRIVATIPAGALDGQAKVELVIGNAAAMPGGGNFLDAGSRRSLGYTFQLNLLEWLNSTAPVLESGGVRLAQPIEFSLDLASTDIQHVDLEQAQLYRWAPEQQQWLALPTFSEPISSAGGSMPTGSRGTLLYSATDRLGAFDLRAPLLCPQDVSEPDDAYFSARSLPASGALRSGRFDTEADEDWLRFDAEPGSRYTVTVMPTADDVGVEVQVYEADGLTPSAASNAIISWSPESPGSYFVRVAPAAASRVGCEAKYTVRIAVE